MIILDTFFRGYFYSSGYSCIFGNFAYIIQLRTLYYTDIVRADLIKSGDKENDRKDILVSGPGTFDVGKGNATKYCDGEIVLTNRRGQTVKFAINK